MNLGKQRKKFLRFNQKMLRVVDRAATCELAIILKHLFSTVDAFYLALSRSVFLEEICPFLDLMN